MHAARVIAALTFLAPLFVAADEWDDPKAPEQLGMRSEWFRRPAPLIAAPAPAPVPSPAAPLWEGDDSQFNPNGAERSKAGVGKLDQQAIKDAIQPHMGEVKFCFAREQAQHPELSGRVIVRFTIAEGGTVSGSEIESSTVESATVDRCVAAAVRRWMFPTPKGGSVTVSWPFKVVAMR